jgi:hypothetical protein
MVAIRAVANRPFCLQPGNRRFIVRRGQATYKSAGGGACPFLVRSIMAPISCLMLMWGISSNVPCTDDMLARFAQSAIEGEKLVFRRCEVGGNAFL